MSTRSFIFPFTQAFQASTGKVGAGWKLNFYQAGSSSIRQTTYTDAERTTPHENPVESDANGRWPQIFLSDDEYNVVLTDDNDVVKDVADDQGLGNLATIEYVDNAVGNQTGDNAPSARFWRIAALGPNVTSEIKIAELYFRTIANGANLSGTMTASSEDGGNVASNVRDGSAATYWAPNAAVDTEVYSPWIYLDQGAGNSAQVNEVSIRAATTDPDHTPLEFILQYSQDGTGWVTVFASKDTGGVFSSGEVRTYDVTDKFSAALSNLGVGGVVYTNAEGAEASNPGALFWSEANNQLGVGTNTPTERLEVDGTVKATALKSTSSITATTSVSSSTAAVAGNATVGDLVVQGGSTLEGTVDVDGNQITNVATPTTGLHAANKSYVDGQVATKPSITTNISAGTGVGANTYFQIGNIQVAMGSGTVGKNATTTVNYSQAFTAVVTVLASPVNTGVQDFDFYVDTIGNTSFRAINGNSSGPAATQFHWVAFGYRS